jgi:PKD repeat protein
LEKKFIGIIYALFSVLFFAPLAFAQDIIQWDYTIQNGYIQTERKCSDYAIRSYNRAKLKNLKFNESFSQSNINIDDTLYIPLVFHIVHHHKNVGEQENITQAQVHSQILILNQDFQRQISTPGFNTNPRGAGMKIKFVPALISPDGSPLSEPGIHRVASDTAAWKTISQIETNLKPITQFDPERYLNIWVLSFTGELASSLGYTQAPNFSQLPFLDNVNGTANTDGIVVRFNAVGNTGNVVAPFNGGRTLTHEMGHFFGLLHIWGKFNDNIDCTQDDGCDDTPQTKGPIYGCPISTNVECTTVTAMKENYMDYTNDACMNVFTIDQVTRMYTALQNSPRRGILTYSTVHLTTVPSPILSFSRNIALKGQTIQVSARDQNGVDSQMQISVLLPDNSILNFNSDQINFTPTQVGNYSFTVIGSNQGLSIAKTYPNALAILKDTVYRIPYRVDFENNSHKSQILTLNNGLSNSWIDNTTLSAANVGTNCKQIDNSKTLDREFGKSSALITPLINFSSSAQVTLQVDYAYARNTSLLSDSIAFYFSADTGKTFTLVQKRGGTLLQTTTIPNNNFVPAANEWRRANIALNGASNNQGVLLKIENISQRANNLYIDNINVIVTNPITVPTSDFLVFPNQGCIGTKVQITDISGEFPTAWSYSITGLKTTTSPIVTSFQNPSITFNIPDSYTISLVASNTLGTGSLISKSAIVEIFPRPSVNYSLSFDSSSLGCSQNRIINFVQPHTYIVSHPSLGSTTVSGQTFSFVKSISGVFDIKAISAQGCENNFTITIAGLNPSDTCNIIIQPTTTSTPIMYSNISIYPNPTEQYLYLKDLHLSDIEQIEVVNAIGQAVQTPILNTGEPTGISVQHLQRGLYYLKIKANGNYYRTSFAKF